MYKEGNCFWGETWPFTWELVSLYVFGENLTEESRLVPSVESFLPGPYYFFQHISITMFYVHVTWGVKLYFTVKDGASKDFFFFFDEFKYSEMVLKTLVL